MISQQDLPLEVGVLRMHTGSRKARQACRDIHMGISCSCCSKGSIERSSTWYWTGICDSGASSSLLWTCIHPWLGSTSAQLNKLVRL